MTKYFKSGLYHDYLFSVGKINWKSSLSVGFGVCLVNYTNYDGISTGQSHPHSLDERRASANLVGSVVVKTCEWVIVKSWLHQKKKHSLTDGSKRGKFSAQQRSSLSPNNVLDWNHFLQLFPESWSIRWGLLIGLQTWPGGIIDNSTGAEAREKGRNIFRWSLAGSKVKFQLGAAVNLNRGGIQRTATDLASFWQETSSS